MDIEIKTCLWCVVFVFVGEKGTCPYQHCSAFDPVELSLCGRFTFCLLVFTEGLLQEQLSCEILPWNNT